MYILFKESKLAETEKCMEGYVLIKQGQIYNGIEEKPWMGDILIKNGKIEKLAEIIEGRIVNDAEIIDATGLHVYPGFVEAHCHLGLDGYTGGLAEEDFNELKAAAVQLMKRIKDIDLYELAESVKQISEFKLQMNDYFDIMMIWYRDILVYKATMDANNLIFKDEVYDIKKQASKSSYQGIETILEALEKAKQRLNANVNFDLVMELLLLTIKEN